MSEAQEAGYGYAVFLRSADDSTITGPARAGISISVHKVKDDLVFLDAFAVRLVRCVDDDFFDEFIHDSRCEFRDVHILFIKSGKGIIVIVRFLLGFYESVHTGCSFQIQ